MNPSKNYIALTEGRMTRSEFLRQARQSFPHLIGAGNSFDDALKILTRKGLINEELIYQNKADKFPLEAIERGIRYELEAMDVYDIHHPSQEQYKKARQRAVDNLGKDPLYYINKVAENTKQPTQEETEGDLKKVEAGSKHTLKEGKYITEAPLEDSPQLNKKFLDLYIKYKDGNYQIKDKETGELRPGKALAPETAAQKACMVVRKSMNAPRFRPDRNTIASCSVGRGKLQYQGEKNGIPSFNYAWSLKEKKAITMRPDEGHGKNHVAPERNFEKEDPRGEKYESDPDMQTADKLFTALMSRSNSDEKTFKTQADGSLRRRTPDECLKLVQKKFPAYRKPFKATMRNFGLTWFRKQDGTTKLELKTVHEAQYGEISKDPVYTQLYQHYLKKAKEAKDVNAEKTARKQAKASYLKYKEKHSMKEQQEKAVLKEHIIGIIGKVLNEAATANLAKLSDENASVAELPGIINSLENIVTEIESFWIKEQQKIQGVFDQVGNIKNEDGLPVGYKFVQPMIESLKKDLEPVLAKITLDDLKLPEAPAPDQTQVNDPNAEVDPNDPNAVPPVEPKQTVFSPAAPKEPLQESKKNKRYTK